MQTALLFQELGHVHYTDLERFGERLDAVPARWRDVFRTIFNAPEDGVVETQMAAEFNVRTDLLVLNETFASRADDRHSRFVDLFAEETADVDTGRLTYTLFEALAVGILDRGLLIMAVSGRSETEKIAEATAQYLVRTVPSERDPVLDELSMKVAGILRNGTIKVLVTPDEGHPRPTNRLDILLALIDESASIGPVDDDPQVASGAIHLIHVLAVQGP